MEFIDHTGHKFSLESYTKYPLGYDTTTLPFTFWLSSYNNGRKLSVKNWYCLPIWILVNQTGEDEEGNWISEEYVETIEIHSSTFWILTYPMLRELGGIEKGTIISNDFKFNENDIIKYGWHDGIYDYRRNDDDYYIECGTKKLIPLYVFGLSEEEGTFTTNILISLSNHYSKETTRNISAPTIANYTPVAISAEFHDECEELVVNGQNLGFDIPKDILNAMYETSYFDKVPDEVLFNRKMKELILNYMNIRGENGNYNSALSSLAWFGYGDKVEFTKLIKTDNQLLAQYIHDSFDINNDLLHSFRTFTNSTLIALRARENEETENVDWQDWDNEFWGEGKPFTEDLFMKVVPVTYDEGDINFWKPFYDWNFTEMALKLSLLSTYLKKYFLPTHLLVKSATIDRKVFINDTKHITSARPFTTEKVVQCWDDVSVSFPEDIIYIYNQKFYVDECYNNIKGYKELGTLTNETIVYINDAVASIPIEFNGSNFYNVNMLITRDGNKVFESKFQFASDSEDNKYESFILYPKTITHPNRWAKYGMSYWIDKTYRISILCNGKWFYHDFVLKVPELQLGIGTLKYNYFTTYEEETIGSKTYEEWLQEAYGEKFDRDNIDKDNVLNQELEDQWQNGTTQLVMKSLFTQIDHISDTEVDFNSFMYVPSLVEVNDIMFYDKLQNALSLEQSSSALITTYETYLKYLASKTYIYDLGIETSKAIYNYGDPVVPLMKFNNGIALGDIDPSFKLVEFYVDVYFDIDTNNTYYAKVTYTLDDLQEGICLTNSILKVQHLKSYANLPDSVLIERKCKLPTENGTLGYPAFKGLGINRTIDWDKTSLDWRQFYIDEYEATRKQCTIRVVWRGRMEGPNNTYYEFGGYDRNGYPLEGYFLENRLDLIGDGYCTMDCPNKLCQSLCKFRKENSKDMDEYDPNDIKNDAAGNSSELEKIANEVTMSNLNKLIKESTFKYKIPDMDKYLNRVHIYDIYNTIKNKEVLFEYKEDAYPDNASQVSLYRQFFNDDGTQKITFDDRSYEYDFYLVHDDTRWFGVFISRMTIDNASNEEDLEGPEEIHYEDYVFKRYRSGNRFFINRMMYEDAAPTYKLDKDSIIVCTINNVNYPYILDINPKWSVVPYSLGIDEIDGIECYTNTALLTIPDRYNTNKEGYYDIKVRYSIDANVNHQQIKKRRVLIK